MKFCVRFATVFIAACAYFTGANAQNVYRCGASYSQTPCPDGTELNVSDPRTAEQKKVSDARIKQQLDAANRIESDRIKEEQRAIAAQNKAAAQAKALSKAQAKEEAARAKTEAKQAKAQAAQAKKAQASLRKSAQQLQAANHKVNTAHKKSPK